MNNVLTFYQQKLRYVLFRNAFYLLIGATLLMAIRYGLTREPRTLLQIAAFGLSTWIIARYRPTLQSGPIDPTRQAIMLAVLLVTGALFVAITLPALIMIGVIVFGALLFFVAFIDSRPNVWRWCNLSGGLFIVALTARQFIPWLKLDYSLDLLITLYIFPLLVFFGCVQLGLALVNYLREILETSATLRQDLDQRDLQYQQLLQTMNEGFVISDEHEVFLYVNDKFCEIFGYSRAELLNQRNEEVLYYDEASAEILRQQTAMRSQHQRSTYELNTCRKDGTPITILVSATPNFDAAEIFRGATCVVLDITARKEAERALHAERALLSQRVDERTASLRETSDALQKELQERKLVERALRIAEEEYRTLFDNVPIGIYRSSLAGRQLRANPALVALNGYTSEAEMLAAVHDIANEWYVDPQRRTDFSCLMIEQGVVENFESEIYRYKSRERIWITETAILVRDAEGQPLYYQGAVQDITARKKSDQAQAKLIEQLAKASRLKDEFLASMSHELRTPLNSILGMTEALLDEIYGGVSDRQRKALGTIDSSGRHLLALINDILDLAKVESGQMTPVLETVDVLAACQSSVRLVQPTAEKKVITVSVVLDERVRTMVADGRRLKQILINLLSNAIKFTPNGGAVGLELKGDAPTPGFLQFIVWDTGVGIAEEAKPHLFQPFVQLDSSLARQYDGTGLGLALVQRMVVLHQGTVTVVSEPGHGSRFTVTLPWVEQASQRYYAAENGHQSLAPSEPPSNKFKLEIDTTVLPIPGQ